MSNGKRSDGKLRPDTDLVQFPLISMRKVNFSNGKVRKLDNLVSVILSGMGAVPIISYCTVWELRQVTMIRTS